MEDESANLNTLSGDSSIFNSNPAPMPSVAAPATPEPNKFIDLPPENPVIPPQAPVEKDKPVIDLTPAPEPEPQLETLFDPMDQVELLDPDYEAKQQEAAGLDLKSAINNTREILDVLKEKGFKVDSEEVDLENEYQIIIKIKKDTTQG